MRAKRLTPEELGSVAKTFGEGWGVEQAATRLGRTRKQLTLALLRSGWEIVPVLTKRTEGRVAALDMRFSHAVITDIRGMLDQGHTENSLASWHGMTRAEFKAKLARSGYKIERTLRPITPIPIGIESNEE